LADIAAPNVFELGINTDNSATYQSLSASRAIGAGIPTKGTQRFDLRFKAPTTTSTGAIQNIKVTITATSP
jgi:hypothetical protein